jgi:hypothetical protein
MGSMPVFLYPLGRQVFSSLSGSCEQITIGARPYSL